MPFFLMRIKCEGWFGDRVSFARRSSPSAVIAFLLGIKLGGQLAERMGITRTNGGAIQGAANSVIVGHFI